MGADFNIPCWLWVGQALCIANIILTFYVLVALTLRVLLGEKVWLHTSFWFYVSAFIYNTIMLPVFMQWDELCDYVCYTYLPAHCAQRTVIIAFIFYKLELFKPQRALSLDIEPESSTIERVCHFIVYLYIFIGGVRFISRFWSSCFRMSYPGGCVAEEDPIIFLGNVPDMVLASCEIVLWFRLVKLSRKLYSDHDFRVQNQWFENEIINRMWYYVVTSFVALTTNLVMYTGLLILGILYILGRLDEVGKSSFWVWIVYLNVGCLNTSINIAMVLLCSPFRSMNIYYLWLDVFNQNSFPKLRDVSSDYSPEQLAEFVELERAKEMKLKRNTELNSRRKIAVRNIKTKLAPGQRVIQRNWEKCPVTGKVRFLPTPSSSPISDSSESSSSGILLVIDDEQEKRGAETHWRNRALE